MVDDKLVYVRGDGALMAVGFDTRRLSFGNPIQVGDSVTARNWDVGAALSATGSLVYQQGGAASQLVRVDLTGHATTEDDIYLVHRRDQGGSPAELVVNDRPLLVCVALWALSVIVIIYQ